MTDVNAGEVLAAAGAVLGTELSDPVTLHDTPVSVVRRVSRADGGTVVVKSFYAYIPTSARSFTAEAAGLAFSPLGPALLGVDDSFPLLVMSDLGVWPSLADVLLGEDPAAAVAGLLDWARAYARIARDSLGREAELDALLDRHSLGEPTWNDSPWIAERLPVFSRQFDELGIEAPAGLGEEIASLEALTRVGPRVFSPGDICPDNNLLTDEGFRVLDFQSAGYHSAYLDVAYVSMPFATCWCVFRMPADIAARVEHAYWSELTGGDLTDADRAGIRTATAAWTLDLVRYLLPPAVQADAPLHRTRRPVPTKRQIIRYRLETARDQLSAAGELPAVAEACGRLLDFTERWETPDLGPYPAFA